MPFKKGQSGNPKGKPPKPAVQALEKAIREVEKEKGESFLKTCVKAAYNEPSVMVAILKKILPDLKQVEGDIGLITNFGVIVLPAKLPAGALCEAEPETVTEDGVKNG